jgi:lysophospholipase L1-like esterase
MLGDSITEGLDWHEQFPEVKVFNRGIGGDTSKGVLNRLGEVIGRHPRIVFLMIGVNDLLSDVPVATVDANIRSIVAALVQKKIHVVLQKTIYANRQYWPEINNRINELNRSLSDLCTTSEVVCVDLNRVLAEGGALSRRFSWDGLHLNAAGYLAWKNEIEAEIKELPTQ